jgi:hypothetical protein
VATLALDTRGGGPAYCEKCDEDVEDVLLLSSAVLVCPRCRTPVAGLSDLLTDAGVLSAKPVCG